MRYALRSTMLMFRLPTRYSNGELKDTHHRRKSRNPRSQYIQNTVRKLQSREKL